MPSQPTSASTRAVLDVRVIPKSLEETPGIRARVQHHAEECVRSQSFVAAGDLTAMLRVHVPEVVLATLTVADDADAAPTQRIPFWRVRLETRVYVCAEDVRAVESDHSAGSSDELAELRDDAAAALAEFANVLEIPSTTLVTAWDSLHLAPGVKTALLGYVRAGWVLAERKVDTQCVAWNGVVLLHGPPGTGKTSLCRALAQKVAIAMEARDAVLVEVRLERLMSKWFSESSQRVRVLFDRVAELSAVRQFVVVVLDEVESVGLSRKGRVDGCEPGDAIRIVNALLGGIDGLREVRNCVVVCTSNLLNGIDEALVDRADVRLYVGTPCQKARMRILGGVIDELKRKGVVGRSEVDSSDGGLTVMDERGAWSVERVCQRCEGLSGRALRKLAVVALGICNADVGNLPVREREFMAALAEAARRMLQTEKEDSGCRDEGAQL